jgi:hypothetical protein
VAALLVAALVFATPSGAPPASAGPSAAVAPAGPPAALFPSGGAYLGAIVEGSGGRSVADPMFELERMMGRPLAVARVYHRWGDAFPTTDDVRSADAGHLLFISWTPLTEQGTVTPWADIASGAWDDWIRARAAAVRAFGRPMYLSFNHEPENDASYGTPAEFVAAYRHVVDVFRAAGVSNVAFVCTLMSSSFEHGATRANAFYPGDAHVDALGVDAYNWYPGREGSRWRSFARIVAPARAYARELDVPLVVPEFGVQEDPRSPGRKAAWLGAAAATLRRWPDVAAVLYFDVDKVYSWQLTTSPLATAAFVAIGSDPWLDVLPPFDEVGAAVGLTAIRG